MTSALSDADRAALRAARRDLVDLIRACIDPKIGRATTGQPCDPTKGSAAASSGGIWAVFGPSFDPARVALCVKR